MADPATQHEPLGVQYQFMPTHVMPFVPNMGQPADYSQIGKMAMQGGEMMLNSPLNPAVHAKMLAEIASAQAGAKALKNADPYLTGTTAGGMGYTIPAAQGGQYYQDLMRKTPGTQPYDPTKDPNSPDYRGPSGTPPPTNQPPPNPNVYSGGPNDPAIAAATAAGRGQPAPSDQPSAPAQPITAHSGYDAYGNPITTPDTNTAGQVPAQTPTTSSGNVFGSPAIARAAPPPAPALASPATRNVQTRTVGDQDSSLTAGSGQVAGVRSTDTGGGVGVLPPANDPVQQQLLSQWQNKTAHPVMSSGDALNWAKGFDTRAQDATYLPTGGPGGEPAYAFHMKGGGVNTVPISQMVKNGAGAAVAGQNTSATLSAAEAAQPPPSQGPGMPFGPVAPQQPPAGQPAPPQGQPGQFGQPLPQTGPPGQPVPLPQTGPPGQPVPLAANQPPPIPQSQVNAATAVPSAGGPPPQYLAAGAGKSAPPPAPAATPGPQVPFQDRVVPYPNPQTSSEATTNNQVATGKVDKNGVATIGNAADDNTNLTNTDGMQHYTGMPATTVQQVYDQVRNNGYNLGRRDNGDPYIGDTPSGKHLFVADKGVGPGAVPYAMEPGDTPFTEHRLYLGSDHWRNVQPEDKQLQANLAAWDHSLSPEVIKRMPIPEVVARLHEQFYQTTGSPLSAQTNKQLNDLQEMLSYAERMRTVMNQLPENKYTTTALQENEKAGQYQNLEGAQGIGDRLKNWVQQKVIGVTSGQTQPDPKQTFLSTNARDLKNAADNYQIGHELPNFEMGPKMTRQQLDTFITNRKIDYQRIMDGAMANREKLTDGQKNYGLNIIRGKPNYDAGNTYANFPSTATATPSATPNASPSPTPLALRSTDANDPVARKKYDALKSGDPYTVDGHPFTKQ